MPSNGMAARCSERYPRPRSDLSIIMKKEPIHLERLAKNIAGIGIPDDETIIEKYPDSWPMLSNKNYNVG